MPDRCLNAPSLEPRPSPNSIVRMGPAAVGQVQVVAAAFVICKKLGPVLVAGGVGTPACYSAYISLDSRTRWPAVVRVLVPPEYWPRPLSHSSLLYLLRPFCCLASSYKVQISYDIFPYGLTSLDKTCVIT